MVMPVITRALLFLYSTPNIVGLLLSLPGVVLYALGVIHVIGVLMIAGLYITGLLATPKRKIGDFSIHTSATASDIQMKWDALVRETGRHGSEEMYIKVKSIKLSTVKMSPLLIKDTSDDRSLAAVRYVVLMYLPDALQTYFSLPPVLVNFHPIHSGKSAYHLLNEQLDLIEREMRKISVVAFTQDKWKLSLYSQIMERTVGQQRFLGDFLGKPPFDYLDHPIAVTSHT